MDSFEQEAIREEKLNYMYRRSEVNRNRYVQSVGDSADLNNLKDGALTQVLGPGDYSTPKPSFGCKSSSVMTDENNSLAASCYVLNCTFI